MKNLKFYLLSVILIPIALSFSSAQDTDKTQALIDNVGSVFPLFIKANGLPTNISGLCSDENSTDAFLEYKGFDAVISNKMISRVIFFPESKVFSYKGVTMESTINEITKKLGKPEDEIIRQGGKGKLLEYSIDDNVISNIYFWLSPDDFLEKVSIEMK
jgi:hypothetical protein